MIKDYIIYDIDTTGLDKDHDYVDQLFAIKVVNNEIKDILSTSFGYNSIEKVKSSFIDWIENLPLITYCQEFNNLFFKLDINNEIIDVTKLSKEIYPNLKRYSITHIAEYLQIDYKNSIELSDSGFLLYEVYKKIKNDQFDEQIKNYIKENKNINVSDIQRKFLIGINRAKKLLESSK